ncbi:MAG: thioredoxin domain-containing protein [Deltaproteobacteria bacterium]|nr:thioredoxin domain-containing protein [Deltaproteobacteria bacterium]
MRVSPNPRLSSASSLYLRQHAMNPVDWWSWGDEAFEEARRRGVPVFVSIGYSACHWCHVMERESFEDEDIAAFLNERFVCVKVDREERPDVDAVYMDALAVIGVPGGWPASLWLTHERAPFYAGTYFAPVPAFGRPGFKQVLEAVDRVWREDPARVVEASGNVRARLIARAEVTRRHEDLPLELIVAAARSLEEGWDNERGGWGRGHKFPMPARVELLLATGNRLNDPPALALARSALTAICEGGLQDQLGGGFHRYCVDPAWTVPHFEKMLFDNAQLLGLLARGAVAFGDARLAQDALATARFSPGRAGRARRRPRRLL